MLKKDLNEFIKNALDEDVGEGDHTSLATMQTSSSNKAALLVKDDGVIAGVTLAKRIFGYIDNNLHMDILIYDGEKVKNGDVAFLVEGKSISILEAERLILNCMQHMSGIATKTNYLHSLISHTKATNLDTRKTTPLNRQIEKWAVRIGGGENHRFGLYDMIMIKDNHIDFAGGISNAIKSTKEYLSKNNKNLDIIVEARNIEEVEEIIDENGIRRILLDNFSYEETRKAVTIINKKYEIESSGGINEDTILQYAECGVDYISVGCLTHSASNFNLSLKAI